MVLTHFLMKFHSLGPNETDPVDTIFHILDQLPQEGFALEKYTLSDDPADGYRDLRYSRQNLVEQLRIFDIDGIFSFKGTYDRRFEFELEFVELGTPGSLFELFVRKIPKQETEPLFQLFVRLNKYLLPVYSGAATPWLTKQPGSQEYNRMLQVKPTQFPRSGPDGITERTYFSAALARLIDVDSLRRTGAHLHEDASGLQVDLLENPWDQDYEDLARRRKEVNTVLDASGILGTYPPFERSSPGPKWPEFFREHLRSIEPA